MLLSRSNKKVSTGIWMRTYPTYIAAPRIEDKVLKRIFVDMAHTVGQEAGLRQMHAFLAIKIPFPIWTRFIARL